MSEKIVENQDSEVEVVYPRLTEEQFNQLVERETFSRIAACWKCTWWNVRLHNIGECRVKPPERVTPGDPNGSFPLTHFMMWCGAFKQA
jgi:hypothetical protein